MNIRPTYMDEQGSKRIWIKFVWINVPRLTVTIRDRWGRTPGTKLPNFQTLSVNFFIQSSFGRTDRVVNIDLYYTS